MKSNQKHPIMPYFLILSCLLVLSIFAPRVWNHWNSEPGSIGESFQWGNLREVEDFVAGAILGPKASGITPAKQEFSEEVVAAVSPTQINTRYVVVDTQASQSVEKFADKITDRPRFDSNLQLVRFPEKLPATAHNGYLGPEATPVSFVDFEPLGEEIELAGWWPKPVSLMRRLQALSSHSAAKEWATQVQQRIDLLCRTSTPEAEDTFHILRELNALSAQAPSVASDLVNEDQLSSEIRRVSYALKRRIDLWQKVITVEELARAREHQLEQKEFASVLEEVHELAEHSENSRALEEELLLEPLTALASTGKYFTSDQERSLARSVLARITTAQSQANITWAKDSRVAKLAQHLQKISHERYDPRDLLLAQEAYELSGLPSSGQQLFEELQRLSSKADSAELLAMRHELEGHYRNANMRLAISGEFVNQLIPQPQAEVAPVQDTIVGVPVRGCSNTSTQLKLRLLPHATQLRFGLEAHGVVDSLTSASSGPVTFLNQGNGAFVVRKLILVDPMGVRVKPAQAEVESSAEVLGLETNYDRIPLVRDLVRNYAMSEHRARQGQAKWETESKIANTALQRFDSQANQQIADAEFRARERLFARFQNLGLNVDPIELRTTDQRFYVRLRVAGGEQLGAHTARPRAPSDSLLSMQFHQSAINNFIEQLDLNGQNFYIDELHDWVAQRLQISLPALDEEAPDDVEITFAEKDAITVTAQNGKLELHFAIDRLQQGRRVWRDFGIRATYVPAPEGMELIWQREGVIELTGERYAGRPEIVLRGIFSKVLHKDRPLNFTPPALKQDPRFQGLQFTQCVAEDGWIGLAVGRSNPLRPQLAKENAALSNLH